MTLGNIFAKLSDVRLLSIAKWYGRIVMYTFMAAVGFAALCGLIWLVISIVTLLPWWFTALVLLLLSAWAALKVGDPEWFKSDFDKAMEESERKIMMGDGMQKTVKRKYINNWQQVREVVEMMTDEQACNIVWDGQEFSFDTRQEALDFLDGKKYG